jgi:hypothetical protein
MELMVVLGIPKVAAICVDLPSWARVTNLTLLKNVTGGILIFIMGDRISVTKILNVSHDNKA